MFMCINRIINIETDKLVSRGTCLKLYEVLFEYMAKHSNQYHVYEVAEIEEYKEQK
jgi:hypothetical protein